MYFADISSSFSRFTLCVLCISVFYSSYVGSLPKCEEKDSTLCFDRLKRDLISNRTTLDLYQEFIFNQTTHDSLTELCEYFRFVHNNTDDVDCPNGTCFENTTVTITPQPREGHGFFEFLCGRFEEWEKFRSCVQKDEVHAAIHQCLRERYEERHPHPPPSTPPPFTDKPPLNETANTTEAAPEKRSTPHAGLTNGTRPPLREPEDTCIIYEDHRVCWTAAIRDECDASDSEFLVELLGAGFDGFMEQAGCADDSSELAAHWKWLIVGLVSGAIFILIIISVVCCIRCACAKKRQESYRQGATPTHYNDEAMQPV